MKYTQEEFENICRPISTDLNVDLTLGPADSYDIRSLSRMCADRITYNLDWGVLGARLALKIIRSNAGKSFSESTKLLSIYLYKPYYDFVIQNADVLDKIPHEEHSDNKQAISINVLEKTYLLKYNKCKNCKKDCPECEKFYVGETPEQMYMRIATFICMPNIDMIKTAYDYLSSQKYSHATPTMFNAGTERHQMASCFVLTVQDSLWSIEDHWTYVGEISRNSGGIGLDVSNIRHSHIANAGKSDGVPALLKPYEAILDYVDQSKKRKGSAAIFLSIWHIDIEEFINLKVPVGTDAEDPTPNLFYSVWVQDLFFKRCKEDKEWTLFCPKRCPGLTEVWGQDFEKLYIEYENQGRGLKKVSARHILQQLYLAQTKTGIPYICVADRFNESNMQKNIGIIRSSNLCVAPETMILTDKGYFPIKSLENQQVNVWNGFEWSDTTVYKTGSQQRMMLVRFNNGTKLYCTPYHKFYLADQCLPAHALKGGMELIDCNFPVLTEIENDVKPDQLSEVPINYSFHTKLNWLKQVLDYAGHRSKAGNMTIKSRINSFLSDIQLMLQTMGCNPFIFTDKKIFRLFISASDLYILGIDSTPVFKSSNPIRVVSATMTSRRCDTYCFSEKKRGMGIFNGVITGQCSEIALHTSEKEIASCNLASICLSNFIQSGNFDFEELIRVTRFIVRVMNNVIDKNYYPERIPQIKYANLKNRPLGIGIQGLANVFAKLELMFDSDEARQLNNKIIQTIYYAAVDESANIAIEKGESYPAYQDSPYSKGQLHPDLWKAPNGTVAKFLPEFDWDGLRVKVSKGMYNSTLLALMPTATSSIIAEQGPCFEPFNFIVGSKTLLSGQYLQVCKEFALDMQNLGVYGKELCDAISTNSLGGLDDIRKNIPESIKKYPLKVARWNFLMDKYRTAYEIGPKASILQGLDRTPFVCQSQSLNWFVPDPSWVKFYKNVIASWEQGAKTIIYYNRGKSGMQARQVAICSSCSS